MRKLRLHDLPLVTLIGSTQNLHILISSPVCFATISLKNQRGRENFLKKERKKKKVSQCHEILHASLCLAGLAESASCWTAHWMCGTVTLDPVAIFLSGSLAIKVYKHVAIMALDLWMFTQILFFSCFQDNLFIKYFVCASIWCEIFILGIRTSEVKT